VALEFRRACMTATAFPTSGRRPIARDRRRRCDFSVSDSVQCRFRRNSSDAPRRTAANAETKPQPVDRNAQQSAGIQCRRARSSPCRRRSRLAVRPPTTFFAVRPFALARPDRHRLDARSVRNCGSLDEDILGQGDHDGAGPSLHRDMIGALNDFRNARGILDLRRHLAVDPKRDA